MQINSWVHENAEMYITLLEVGNEGPHLKPMNVFGSMLQLLIVSLIQDLIAVGLVWGLQANVEQLP